MNDLLSLTDLFNRSIFRIPDYQRGYSWGELQFASKQGPLYRYDFFKKIR